jgi:hypothetical protein
MSFKKLTLYQRLFSFELSFLLKIDTVMKDLVFLIMRKVLLILIVNIGFLYGQSSSIKKSYKDQIISGDIDKDKIEYYENSSGVYSNFKYGVAFKKPKNWDYDYGSGQYTMFRTYQIDSGYTLSILGIETDVYSKFKDIHQVLDAIGEKKFKEQTLKLFTNTKQSKPINLRVKKTWHNDIPILKTTHTFTS